MTAPAIRMSIARSLLLFLFPSLAYGQSIDRKDQEFWNAKFSNPGTAFSRRPSRLLTEAIRDRQPGNALDLGMGEGRNTIFLAQQGWHSTGVDQSDVGVTQARARAAQLHVTVEAVVDDLDHFPFGEHKWDLIALFYVHAWYQDSRAKSRQRLITALKPGGLLLMEGFAGSEKFLFHSNELLGDFDGLRILRYEDVQDEAEWAPGRRSHIIRLVAEKAK